MNTQLDLSMQEDVYSLKANGQSSNAETSTNRCTLYIVTERSALVLANTFSLLATVSVVPVSASVYAVGDTTTITLVLQGVAAKTVSDLKGKVANFIETLSIEMG